MLILFPQKPYRIPDQNGKSLYPFPGRNGAKTIPFEATHIYRYDLYKERLYKFREFTNLHCKGVMPPQNSNQDLNRDSNCLFLTKRRKTFC